MWNISKYLEKFTKIKDTSDDHKEVILKVLKEVCGATEAEIEIRKGILYIKRPNILKTIVFTKKSEILRILKTDYPHIPISDIR
jgi:hypothetical protein